jgi:hypothetical protein
MPDLPSHRDTGSAGSTEPAPIGGWSRGRKLLLVAVVVGVLVLLAVLHLTGVVGAEGH